MMIGAAGCWRAPLLALAAAGPRAGRRAERIVADAEGAAGPLKFDELLQGLDSVPVFALRLVQEGKLYSVEGRCMVYVELADASNVLGQLQSLYPETPLALQPLQLGTVIRLSAGDRRLAGRADPDETPTAMRLVASRDARRAARDLGAEPSAEAALSPDVDPRRMSEVPVFHLGPLAPPADADAPDEQPLWPLFFRTDDADAMWREFGGGAPRPPLQATDLAALCGLAVPAPGRPLLCAPLDSLEYVETARSAEAERQSELRQAGP